MTPTFKTDTLRRIWTHSKELDLAKRSQVTKTNNRFSMGIWKTQKGLKYDFKKMQIVNIYYSDTAFNRAYYSFRDSFIYINDFKYRDVLKIDPINHNLMVGKRYYQEDLSKTRLLILERDNPLAISSDTSKSK